MSFCPNGVSSVALSMSHARTATGCDAGAVPKANRRAKFLEACAELEHRITVRLE
jgi:hypothetical protein